MAKAICAVVTVVDPELVVLGGGIGQAPGFAAAVTAELRQLAPVLPEVRVSALGTDASWTAAWPPGPSWPGQRCWPAVSAPAPD